MDTKRKEQSDVEAVDSPNPKKFCTDTTCKYGDLEKSLNEILTCSVCLELPPKSVYQCVHGHLMCNKCFHHILADARLTSSDPTCPNCRIEISLKACNRNIAVEQTISELPVNCTHCHETLTRKKLSHHQSELCVERPITCENHIIGCKWIGPFKSVEKHQSECEQLQATGDKIIPYIKEQLELQKVKENKFESFLRILSYDKFIFVDVQLWPNNGEPCINNVRYESSRFTAYGGTFILNLRINNDMKNCHFSAERHLSYQLVMKCKTSEGLFRIHYSIVRAPHAELLCEPHSAEHEFTEAESESKWTNLPLHKNGPDVNQLLTGKVLNMRLLMAKQSLKNVY